jgi:hypothetical protein
MMDEIDYLVPCHGKSPIDPKILFDLKGGVENVITGKIKGIPHETSLGSGLLCRFNACGILYREDNL